LPDFLIIRRGLIVQEFSAATRQEANTLLRAKATADLADYTLAQVLRTATPIVTTTLNRVDEQDRAV